MDTLLLDRVSISSFLQKLNGQKAIVDRLVIPANLLHIITGRPIHFITDN